MSYNQDFFEAKFPFIVKNLFLVALVDKKSGKQKLIIQKVNPESGKIEFEDELDCIHTAITTISYEEFLEVHGDEDSVENFTKKVLNARSTEKLKIVDLSPDEHFFALKSWTQGIAETGLNSLYLQSEIENNAQFQYPIADFLLESLIKIDLDYTGLFLENVKKTCKYEGIYHKPSLRANIDLILDALTFYLYEVDLDRIKKLKLTDILLDIAELDPEFLFRESSLKIKEIIAGSEQFTKFEMFSVLFSDYFSEIRLALARNLKAAKFKEYKKLFDDFRWEIRRTVAKNPNAIQFEEYKNLIPNEIATSQLNAARSPEATEYDEYQ